ncbi:hypothetical protein BO70DRAFT_359812 [Aspergillus heteromorphus CBS 117.55]|uniref:Uncharacterized protein n=1 Tax=Aspergillus heteromorphus CBS 117.55 TaxID=1448321 RepID=A0A317WRL4_9EURO|nr:uncharacterized protein BO70DRAFT_359812 [Aspergillus heteromorphus CBS 117.55]PWY88371.1 hypothetical protein BO70DRAFT_359812 [Aspergillus heteromorphus CBS 117.55]
MGISHSVTILAGLSLLGTVVIYVLGCHGAQLRMLNPVAVPESSVIGAEAYKIASG